MTGTIGARLHIAFPVLNRSSFGFWFSYFTVFSRVILAMFWFSIQVRPVSAESYDILAQNRPDIHRFTGNIPGGHAHFI